MIGINKNNENDSFVGLILPDGSPYQAESSHLWAAKEQCFLQNITLLMQFFETNPNYTKEQLDNAMNRFMIFDGDDKLVILLSRYFRNLVLSENGEEKLRSLARNIDTIDRNVKQYKDDNKNPENQGYFVLHASRLLYFKDILVSALDCHYVSRKTKAIVTSARNYKELFATEILDGYDVDFVPRLEYSYEQHKFVLPSDSLRFHRETLEEERRGESEPNFSYYGKAK